MNISSYWPKSFLRLFITSKLICSIERPESLELTTSFILFKTSIVGTLLFNFIIWFFISPVSVRNTETILWLSTFISWIDFIKLFLTDGASITHVNFVSSDNKLLVCLTILSTSSIAESTMYCFILKFSSAVSRWLSINLSTYNLYPLLDGILPAEACGCSKYPRSSRSAISFLTVADPIPKS